MPWCIGEYLNLVVFGLQVSGLVELRGLGYLVGWRPMFSRGDSIGSLFELVSMCNILSGIIGLGVWVSLRGPGSL